MNGALTISEGQEIQKEFRRHQVRLGPINAGCPGFVSVSGGPIHRSRWLYFSGKWETPKLMDKWQSEPKHKPMQEAAHSRWFASVYLRKWRLPENNEAFVGPPLCGLAIARQDALAQALIYRILDE